MLRNRQVRAHVGGKIDDLLEEEGMDNTKPKVRKADCMRIEPRSQSGGTEFVDLGFSCHDVFVSS